MTDPLVTIGITAYNAEDSIAKAIESALLQDWKPIEIVVVDDYSTDGTVASVEAAAARHDEVRLIRHDRNLGAGAARNTIIREAAGEFIAFFDDDDESAPDRITRQVERIRNCESILPPGASVICHAARHQIYPDGSSRIEGTMGTHPDRPPPSGIAVAHRILKGTPMRDGFGSCATCSQMARRSTYQSVGGFDPSFRRSEDTDLCVRLALAGAHFAGIGEPLVTQEMNVSSEKGLATEREYFLALLQKHRDQLGEETQFALRWTALKYDRMLGKRTAFVGDLLRLAATNPISVLKRGLYALPSWTSRASVRKLHQR